MCWYIAIARMRIRSVELDLHTSFDWASRKVDVDITANLRSYKLAYFWFIVSGLSLCVHSGQSMHYKGWGFEILKNCKRVGVHIFPLKRVD